jgi:hypothetical protein
VGTARRKAAPTHRTKPTKMDAHTHTQLRHNLFPVMYEQNFYIVFRRNNAEITPAHIAVLVPAFKNMRLQKTCTNKKIKSF